MSQSLQKNLRSTIRTNLLAEDVKSLNLADEGKTIILKEIKSIIDLIVESKSKNQPDEIRSIFVQMGLLTYRYFEIKLKQQFLDIDMSVILGFLGLADKLK